MESYFVKWFMHLTSKDFFSLFLLFAFFSMEKWIWNFMKYFFRIVVYYVEFYLQVPGLFRKFTNVKCVVIWLYLYLKYWIFCNFKRDLIQFQIKKQTLNIRNQKITKFTWTMRKRPGSELCKWKKKKPQKSQNSSNNLPLTSSIAV